MAVRGRLEPADAADVGAGLVPYGVAVWRRLGSLSWSKLTGPADVADVRGGADVACASHEAGASPLLCRGAEFRWEGAVRAYSLAPRRGFPLCGGVEVGPVVLPVWRWSKGGVWDRFASCFAARRSLGLRRRCRTALFRCYRRSVLRRSMPIVSTSQFWLRRLCRCGVSRCACSDVLLST